MKRIGIAVLAALTLFTSVPAGAVETGLFDFFAGQRESGETEEIECEDIRPKRGDHAPRRHEHPERREEDAAQTAVVGWYCKHEKDGKRPALPREFAGLEENGGIYLGPDEPVIYLTFDAGYENGNVEKILDVLKEEEVPGAFFILENLVERNPELVERMAAEGHLVCNHTAHHKNMTTLSQAAFERELREMEDCYRELTGAELAKFYRPPEGKVTADNLRWAKGMGYATVLWSFAYADWDNAHQMKPADAVEKVIAGTHNGEVLLLHPTSATNAEILPELIHRWKNMGYRFGTLDELTARGGT